MDELESKMSAILSDPEMMQKISAMAQSLGLGGAQNSPPTPPEEKPKQEPSFPDIDLSMLQKLSGFAKQSGIDKNQQSLLRALGPYLSRERIGKLERAMRAAAMAKMASSFLGKNGLSLSLGR